MPSSVSTPPHEPLLMKIVEVCSRSESNERGIVRIHSSIINVSAPKMGTTFTDVL